MEIQKHEVGAMPKMLTVEYPAIAKEWDYTRNGGLKPEDFACGSQMKVKWKCERGHSWEQTIISRTLGRGCPFCNRIRKLMPGINDLLTIAPKIASEWDYEGNGDLRPDNVLATSRRIVKWRCGSGHQWEARISDRLRGAGCPYDSGKQMQFLETDKRNNAQQKTDLPSDGEKHG